MATLTITQSSLLRFVSKQKDGRTTVFGSARVTAAKLHDLGLVTFTNGGWVVITDSGRAAARRPL